MDDDDFPGECPSCTSEISYIHPDVNGEGRVVCPSCGDDFEVDDIWPEA